VAEIGGFWHGTIAKADRIAARVLAWDFSRDFWDREHLPSVSTWWAQLARTPPGSGVTRRGLTDMTRVYGRLDTTDHSLVFRPRNYGRHLPGWDAPWTAISRLQMVKRAPGVKSMFRSNSGWTTLELTFYDGSRIYFQGGPNLADWVLKNDRTGDGRLPPA
jgi:hypothetical protein